MPSPDLMSELARAVHVTKKELNTLDDLAGQLEHAADMAIKHPNPVTLAALRDRRAALLEWQLADRRHQGIALRARAIGAFKEAEVPV